MSENYDSFQFTEQEAGAAATAERILALDAQIQYLETRNVLLRAAVDRLNSEVQAHRARYSDDAADLADDAAERSDEGPTEST